MSAESGKPASLEAGPAREARRPSADEATEAVRTLLAWMGEAPGRAGLLKTPERVIRSLERLTDSDGRTLDDLLQGGVFEEKGAGLVLVRDVEFYSLCEHHLLPFFGRCHVAYLPADRIIGLSRIPGLVDHFARRLQVQERLTQQVAGSVERAIRPRGVACMVEGFHLCMAMRGVEKQRAVAVTTSFKGVFEDEPARRHELGDLFRQGGNLRL